MGNLPAESEDDKEINTSNDYAIGGGENLANHSSSLNGQGRFVRQSIATTPVFRSRQAAFRYAAWLIVLANGLPDEAGQEDVTFDDVYDAISAT